MRALHLFFRLHLPHKLRDDWKSTAKLDYFDDEAAFRETDRNEYQPFLALLERNAQKYPDLKLSLSISGPWIEQAQKYNPELIERVHKLANLGCVELLIEPYNYSLAFFYNQEEFSAQVTLHQQKMEQLFGSNSRILALPELMYSDRIAKWAEKADFQGILAGAAETPLDWRSTNQVFGALESPKIRLLFQNTRLSRAILHATDEATIEESVSTKELTDESTSVLSDSPDALPTKKSASAADATTFARSLAQNRVKLHESASKTRSRNFKQTFSAQKFQKSLELDSLHGNLISLCLDTSIFQLWRDQGIIRFFDELFAFWSKTPRHLLLNASGSLESMTPNYDVSIKSTINWRSEPSAIARPSTNLVKLGQARNSPPEWLAHPGQIQASQKLYHLRDDVIRTKDSDLLQTFHKLANLDYLTTGADTPSLSGKSKIDPQNPDLFSLYITILDDFAQKVLAKQPQPAKLSATSTRPHSNASKNSRQNSSQEPQQNPLKTLLQDDELENDDEFSVPIYRVTKVRAKKPAPKEIQDAAEEVQILAQRLSRKKKVTEQELSELTEAELVVPTKPKRSGRRFMKKLVIE